VLDPSCGAGGLSDWVIAAQQHGKMKASTVSAVGPLLIGQLFQIAAIHIILSVAAIQFVYFLGFNILDASQPSLVSKLAPGSRKGAATSVYNSTQSIGLTRRRDGAGRLNFSVLGTRVLLAYNRRMHEAANARRGDKGFSRRIEFEQCCRSKGNGAIARAVSNREGTSPI
jgi:hypothetical protein